MKKQKDLLKMTQEELKQDIDEEYKKLNLSPEEELKVRDLSERFANILFKKWLDYRNSIRKTK